MKTFARVVLQAVCTAVSVSVLECAAAPVDRALLIAVGSYEYLRIAPLKGPRNDVLAMRRALQHLNVEPSRIVELSDDAPTHRLPSRANILRALKELQQVAQRGETVLLYWSGHGAQIPQALPLKPGAWVEPDGLDEVFITRDSKLWDNATRRVSGALLDDDIGDAVASLATKGVNVWAIFDTCHAGDMLRSARRVEPGTVWRGVTLDELGIPPLRQPNPGKRQPRQPPPAKRSFLDDSRISRDMGAGPGVGQVIAFYATYPDERAPEMPLPDLNHPSGSPSGAKAYFGLFTWSIATSLMASVEPTFRELTTAVKERYASHKTSAPTPMFEGPLDRRLR